ncbi:hydrocephalus-inducing protein homolog isoform X11 [Physella acuta]|uniref:hydrocephalus-inducing protein homolog isoform X11 n=1 Tax=Physella acuta TaxID=109671 RepID=UPI0027DDC296|nr:hydrocephalus-inducing protein homolog isoform X11 [Physella acuta]
MPLGPFGEILGTTGTLEVLGPLAQKYKSKVIAPRNPKLVRDNNPQEFKMRPSTFLFEASLSTEQKLATTHIMKVPNKTELLDMGDTSLQKVSKVNIDEPMFQPFPSEIFFQNFEPFKMYEVPLVLRNNDKVPRLVKVTQEDSPYFKVISPHDVGHKVGPGLPTTFKIQFTPEEKKDYKHELVCITEREKFTVPIKAIGARGILDFPDDIHFTTCPVKYSNTRTLLVRNIGTREAKFHLRTEPPFFVTPDIGTLAVKDSMQITIEFKPLFAGDHKGEICLVYDTGEEVYINLYGASQDASIRLDKNTVKMESTYISMASQRTVVIHNRSDFIAHFRWTTFATQDEEDQHRLMQQIQLDREEHSDTDHFLAECVCDPTLRDKLSILSRTFQNRKRAVENDPQLFEDDVISIMPVEGDIWPNATFEITIIFKPREATQYTKTAYCDITGRESRLPLRIKGDGAGPKVDFSFEYLEMGNIFIGSKHLYEIVIANKGDIDAIFSVVPNSSTFGPCFAFNPSEGIVMPGGHQAIEVSFSSPYLGDFQEVFCFQIDGQPLQSKITFIGQVVGPTFNFDVADLKFGTVPIGFPSSQECTLVNTSLIPMIFHLRVPGDGSRTAISCLADVSDNPLGLGPLPIADPKEFEIIPAHGLVSPQGQIKVKVNFVPNTIKKYEMALVVDVERVGEEIMSLPISAKSVVPDIINLTPVLNYGRCFLRHPYEHNVQLHNDTEFAAKYEIIHQENITVNDCLSEKLPITYHSPKPKGIIAPHSVVDIPLVIEAVALEEQEIPCLIRIFGQDKHPMIVHVICVGEGPVVHINPLQLDWGDIPVLTDIKKTIVLSNESFIPAQFTAHMVRPNTVFKVIPSEGEIPPEKSAEITVIANLDDCVRFQEKLQINFQQSQCRVIPLQAHGKGTTIVSDPPLGTLLDLGPNFSNNKLIRKFKLTNQGRRIQQLVWLTNGFIPLSKAKRDRIRVDVKKSTHRANEPAEPVFQLSPNRMELLPGESTELTIEGFVDGPRTVAETIMCHAIIGRSGGKIPIINVDVKAEFIEPLLSFSTKCVFFRVDKAPTDELQTQQKQIVLTNVSSLPLTIKLKLAYPFSIIICNENIYKLEACLQSGEDYKLVIQFDPQFKDDSHIRSIDEVLYVSYKEHPHVDYISLRGEVYFPNLLFEKNTVDFGCILNDTEVTRYINITNNSPMEVCYRWSFLVGDGNTEIKKFIRPREDSGVDNAGVNDEEDSGLEEDEEDELRQHEEASGPEEDHVEDVIDPMNPEPTDKITLTKKTPNSDDNKNDEVDLQPISPVDEDAPEKGQLDQEEKKEKSKRSGKSSVLAQLALKKEEEEALMANRVLTALLETEEDIAPVIGVEEVFDILPLYGCLQPGDTEQVTFTFYGHTDIWGKVKAICEVNGGPTYELTLTGEASLLEYTFDTQAIDLGKQMYDHVGSSSITLVNTGKVGFKFSGINMDPALQKRPLPGQPIIIPHSGYVEPFCKQEIQIKYLPGVPEIFEKTFQIQVAHFEPDTITLRGEGVFPRISLDLPRLEDDDGLYNSLLQEAKYNLTNLLKQQQEQQKKVQADNSDEEEELVKLMSADESGVEMKDSARGDKSGNNSGDHVREPTELEILMEVERLAVRDYARENQSFTKLLLASVDEAGESLPQVDSTATLCASELFSSKIKPTLPEYLLDFGYVVLGAMRTHVVRVTNTGWMPVSFKLERENIHQLGFHIELDRVRNLPGAPDNETLDFVVSFDPRGANLHLGFVETVVPINIAHGPVVNMRLRAHVTMPDLEVSQDVLEFDEVKCGECKVITIQLYNHQMVKCEWNSVPPDESKKIDKHVPMHLRRKMKQNKKKSHIFEVLPPTGVLMPGQRINVQVKFMPTEEKFYENRIPIRIAQSSQRILLLCHGQGLEPRLEFDRSVVKFGPILPHSPGDDQEILVKNPCPFPIEFYSLEFDTNYLEEEKILRLMRGYDEFNTLLLPPRPVGSKLPPELIEYYEDQLRKLEEEEKARELEAIEAKKRAEEEAEAAEKEAESVDENQNEAAVRDVTPAEPVLQPSKQGVNSELAIAASKERKDDLLNDKLKASSTGMMGVGELEITPVSAAIARYLGIDLTPEGKAARNRRGIAIIVHGAPVSGKTSTAISLAKHYEAALLTIDGIVCDAIANGNTPAGQRARELCMEAAKRKSEEIRELEQVEMEKKIGLSVEQVTAHTQGAAGAAGTSMGSNRKTSTIMEQKNKEKQSTLSKNTGVNSSIEGATSPLPVVAPVARKLSISASVAGEEGLVSCVLPDELLVEILAERLQLNDCHRGVVFDGLDTLFSLNYFMTASAILKALNNRRFIYFVTLKLDYNVLKEQEKRAQEEKVLEEQLKEEKELLWLEEMDEEEYDALPEDIKARIDLKRLNLKKERIKKEQQEKAERERIEREAREEEERKKEEENRSKKGKGKKGTAPAPDKKTPAGGKVASKAQFSKAQEADKGTGSDRPESHLTEKSDNLAEDHKKKKGKGKKEGTELSSSAEEVKDLAKEAELLLMSRFRTFETYQKDIQDLLEFWDRTSLLPRRPNTPSDKSDEDHKETSLSARKGKSKASLFTKDDEKLDKEKLKEVERIRMERELAEKVAKESAQAEEQKEVVEEEKKDEVGVPHIIVDCGERIVMLYQRILDTLPSTTDVLDGLGLGTQGPPIPPPATFAVIPFPVKRKPPPLPEMGGGYTFIAAYPDDPNVGIEEKSKEEVEEEAAVVEKLSKEENAKKGGKGADKGRTSTEQKRSAERKKNRRNSVAQAASPTSEGGIPADDPAQQGAQPTAENLIPPKPLTIFRWTVQANGEVKLKLRFLSDDLGQFDQTMNFEIVGTRRRYQLFCRGVCAFPTISKEPRIVFQSRKKNRRLDEIVHKKYILNTETFEFGPLLVGKSRDKYREGKYPENMETITILNTSPLDSEVSFCFLHDSKGDTYLLEPPNMLLKPGESSTLTIWAYPKGPGHYEDAIVCCIKENPEPVVFKVCCDGYRPELELDKKMLHFDKVLLHRKDTKTIYLRNSTQLPVAWKLSGLENLGDDFTVAADSGIVEPLSEYPLHAYFRAMKAVSTNRKMIRIEISDADNIMGVVHTEPIQVIAEAYDVALDMSFPKGTDGGLDFGTLRINEEGRQSCTLKNKGKYEIAYNFLLEYPDSKSQEIVSLFSVVPSSGKLSPQDRPTQVQVIFKSSREVQIKDIPLLKCQVIEPSLSPPRGEVIASIPVKVSVKAVFSKFQITPVSDINFGALLINSKKTRTFVIENKGEFDFRFTITKKEREVNAQGTARQNRPLVKGDKKGRDDTSSTPSAKPKKTESVRQDPSQSKLQLGMFTIFPAFGIILPNGNQVITVDCVGETPGREVQEISIEVTDREPGSQKGGIPYKLVAETCIPAINVDDIGNIFEEHRVCKNLSVWQHSNCGNLEVGGVYGEEERKFVFNNVIVGRTAKARFKISNNNKVPCDVVFTLKPVMVKGAPKSLDVFDLDPPRMQIANHSHIYATVSFTPPSMQSFSAIFEAAVEGASANQAKGKSLIFEISGEGNLPRITISKPSIRNKSGQPLLLFKRILLGRSDSLPFELFNDGNLPSKVAIDLLDSDHAFMLKPTNQTRNIIGDINYNEIETRRRAHTASLVVNPNERATFEVIYQPNAPQRSLANLKVTVTDNQYEDYLVQMVGEGYEDDITLDNIGSDLVTIDPENELIASADDSIEAAKSNLMNFGDCYINESKTLNLTMTNHSKTDCVRFQWPSHPQFKFSPEVGHLHASCTKDISVTFKSKKPEVLNQVPLQCKVTKIVFDKPIEQVCDWDDKIQVVKWVDNLSATPTLTESGSKSTVAPVKTGKKKVIETETEPANTEIPDTSRDLELLVSAIIDFTKCTCDVETIHFKSTPMFQTRVYSLVLKNEGPVSFDYNWLVVMDSFTPMMRRSVTFLSEGDRPESRVDVVETQYIPFSVEPQYGTIAAGCKMNVVVKFAPLDANDYEGRLICSVPFMNKGEQGPVIGVKGRSIMPYCHFELEESDYLARAKNNHENHNQGNAVQGPNVDPTTRVIEFNVCGIGIKCFKEFGIINPTNEPFTFEWICEDDNDPKQPVCFKCAQPVGEIKNGRKCKVGFEFTSYTLEATESFWRFTIPSRAITIPFLLVGYTREPNICLDRSHLNFKTLLVGREARDTVYLTNNEDTYFNFAFVEDSCHSEGYSAHLKVDPMHGHIPPHSSIPVNLSFSPKTEKETNFNLRCVIQHKKSPVTLNVKAEGYSMNSILLCEDSTGNRVELSDRGVNQINFGEVEVSENIIRHLFLLNTGKFNFDYSCDFHEKTLGTDAVTVTPPRGGVMFGETQEISLAFCPPRKMSLKCCELALKVTNGPTYELCITGQGVVPGILFSFRSHNFGNCFVYKAGLELPKEQAILKLTNKDKKEVSVDCLYSPTSHLSHKFETCVIAPGKTLKVPFTFCPTQPIKYHETVVFEINGLNKQKVEFYGTGHEMKIEVLDPKQKCLNLGARMVGDNVRKFIPIVNNSPSPITFNLALTPTEPALQQKEVLSITPKEQITLDANGGTMKVEVWFRPKARIPQFAEEVLMECSGMSQPIFVVKGSCLGMEVNLDSDYLAFGTVYQRSSSTRKLVMTNSGDMNTKFRWDIKRFKPDFSISPVEGYITPGMEVTFDVVFQPQSVNGDVRYDKLKCYLDGGPHKPITLTLTGSCTGIPPVKEVQNFQCVVRQTETRQLMIPNKSNQLWNLKPIIDGEHWTGPVSFIVEPQQTKSYELTYKPLTMTAENKKHTGSIFFPLPDGSGLLFNLTGVAEPPKVTARIQRDIPCKTGYTELITVSNWLKKPQRFRVKIEPIKPEKLDAGITVKGVEYVDVPANGKKDYKLYFYAYKEGQTILKVTFINEQTGEYQFYEVTFRATKPGTISTINLSTPVRQSIQYTITVDNPLNTQVIFLISCTVPEILVPNMLAVPAGSQGLFTFEYQPLKIGETTGRLELNCTELGQYMYDLVLNATPGVPEKPIYFKTGLGSSVVQVAKFLNFAKQKTDYTCKIDNTDFHVEKTVAAAPGSPGGTEVALEVVFEPSKLGEQRASLMVSSAVGGEYIFPLFGTCTAPKPQGPFIIKTGTTIPIIFRNVFSTATPFTFQVDNPLFHLTKHGETIRPHKDHRIVVGYDGQDSNSKNPVMGKLVVSCARAAGGNSNAQWIFYLKGIPY